VLYLKDEDISLSKEEEVYVKRYGALARALSDSEILRISRGQAARMIGPLGQEADAEDGEAL
jgi:hypothetical protein